MENYHSQAESAKHRAELELERAGLLERVAEIQAELGLKVVGKRGRPAKAVAEAPKRRGRPPKAKVAADAPKKRGRPAKAKVAEAPKKRGRPAKAKVAAEAPKKRGRPPKADAKVKADKPKRIELPELLETIVQKHGKAMKHEELVVAAREAGYKSEAKDFSNMVYQCLVKLVKKGTLAKANEGKNAEYSFRAA